VVGSAGVRKASLGEDGRETGSVDNYAIGSLLTLPGLTGQAICSCPPSASWRPSQSLVRAGGCYVPCISFRHLLLRASPLSDLSEAYGYGPVFFLTSLWGAAVSMGFYFVPVGGTAWALALFSLSGVPWAGLHQIMWTVITLAVGDRKDAGLICIIARSLGDILPFLFVGLLA
jgi:hypothetical protein